MSIQENIETTIQSVKKSPMDLNLRLKLIQLYLVEAEWGKALTTTQGYLKLNPKDEQSKHLLLSNIECEIVRKKVFSNEITVTEYAYANENIIAFQKDILNDYFRKTDKHLIDEKFVSFVDSLDSELSIMIPQNKEIQTHNGLWLDTDMRTACVVELFCQGRYYWLPMVDIKKINFKPNEILTDILWRRVEIELVNGHMTAGFMPVRYVMTENLSLTDEIKYAKLTQWQDINGFSIAQGQKVWSNGDIDVGLLDIFQIA